jgi:beta-glucosidase
VPGTPGSQGKTNYSEGIFVGYRWFDKQKIQPLFPFGYGLSYTHFVYSDLNTAPDADGGLVVSFVVKNTGDRASDEVPQVYLGRPLQPPKGIPFAVRALAAFDRIHLAPGQSQSVALHICARSFQFWSMVSNRWITAGGERMVYAGPSSRDLPLQAFVTISPR